LTSKDEANLFDGDEWKNFEIDATGEKIDLDASYPKVVKGSWFALVGGDLAGSDVGYGGLYRPRGVAQRSHSEFRLSARITRLRSDGTENRTQFGRRSTLGLVQSEELTFAERPLLYPLCGNVIAFDLRVAGLAVGQLLAVTGKRQRVTVGATTAGVTFVGNS